MKHGLIAASLVLVAGTAFGCGSGGGSGSDGAPADASEKDFCANFEAISKDLSELGQDAKDADVVKALKDAGDKIEETGTPESISEDGRKGFDVTVKLIKDLDDDATPEDIANLDKELSDTEAKQQKAFNDYLGETCDV